LEDDKQGKEEENKEIVLEENVVPESIEESKDLEPVPANLT
jgi:hypothetical protein